MLEESTKALVLESKRNSLDPREKDKSLQFLECGDPLSAFNEFELRKSNFEPHLITDSEIKHRMNILFKTEIEANPNPGTSLQRKPILSNQLFFQF